MRGVYLIHFERRIGDTSKPHGSAQHYLGWASDIAARLRKHKAGNGSRLMAAVAAQDIGWTCVRRWRDATRADERRLHKRKNSAHLCPICHPPRR